MVAARHQEHWKKIAGLTFAFVACLLVGAGIFTVLETKVVKVSKLVPTKEWTDFAEYVKNGNPEQLSNITSAQQWTKIEPKCEYVDDAKTLLAKWPVNCGTHELEEMLNIVKVACGNETSVMADVEEATPFDLMEAVFFSMTVLTTIGFGHISPKTAAGKIFCIVYAIIGIPLTGLLLAALGDTFSTGLMYLYNRGFRFWCRSRDPDIGDDESAEVVTRASTDRKRHKLLFAAVIYGLVGVSLLMSLPALIFTAIEGWNFNDAMYVSFVTLTTIGFGDLVPGLHMENQALDVVYKTVLILWVVIGLAYWATVFSFISKGLRAIRLKAVNAQARLALQQLGFVQRDPKFVCENSKAAISMVVRLAQALASEADFDDPLAIALEAANGVLDSGTGTLTPSNVDCEEGNTAASEDHFEETHSVSSTEPTTAIPVNDGNNA